MYFLLYLLLVFFLLPYRIYGEIKLCNLVIFISVLYTVGVARWLSGRASDLRSRGPQVVY